MVTIEQVASDVSPETWVAFLIHVEDDDARPLSGARIEVTVVMDSPSGSGEFKWAGQTSPEGLLKIDFPPRRAAATYSVTAQILEASESIQGKVATVGGVVSDLAVEVNGQ